MGKTVTHKSDIRINKDKLRVIMDNYNNARNLKEYYTFAELFNRVKEKYGFDLLYKGFMSLIDNRNTWKTIYSWAIADILECKIEDLFYVEKLDIEEQMKKREEWNRKYNKKYDSPNDNDN